MKNVLLDTYKETGKDKSLSAVGLMAARTFTETFHPKDASFLSLCRVPDVQEPGMVIFFNFSRDNLLDFLEYGDALRIVKMKISDIGPEYYQEMVETTGLMMLIGEKKFLVSQTAFLTMCQQAMLGGDAVTTRSTPMRDMHLADAFFQKEGLVTAVYRTDKNVNKIFAVFAGKHVHIGQEYIFFGASCLNNALVHHYEVTNTVTDVFLELNEKDDEKGMPKKGIMISDKGIMISDSDTGHSSLCARPVYYVEDTYVIADEIVLKHSSKLNFSVINGALWDAEKHLKEDRFIGTIEALKGSANPKTVIREAFKGFMSPSRQEELLIMINPQDKDKIDKRILLSAIYKAIPHVDYKDRGKSLKLHRAAYFIPFLM